MCGVNNLSKHAYCAGCILALLGVVFGAFGQHALSELLQGNGYMSTYKAAVSYQFYHALGLLFLGLYSQWQVNIRYLRAAIYVMLLGTLVFSGSLYALTLTGIKGLGAITPLGGVMLIVAWSLVIVNVLKQENSSV